jgi:branched-chain amino acid transport system permease protein
VSSSLPSLGLFAYIAASSVLAFIFPQSVLAFLLVEASLLLLCYVPAPLKIKIYLAALVLLILIPFLGTFNGYYLEVAIQIGIYVALALGLNIVVGFVGLLNLGFVAFYAIGAYLWAIFGSPQANEFIRGGFFPLSANWFFLFLIFSIVVGALTGTLLGLPVLRLRGDYLAIVTLGFAEVVRALVNNLDKPINITNGPKGISPIVKPPLFFKPWLEFLGLEIADSTLYPLYFYFLILVMALLIILITRRLEDSRVGRAWKAIREDELAASAMGVPVVRMKLFAFAVGASFASAVGVLFAAKQVFINLQLLKGLSLWLNGLRQSGAELTLPLLGSYSLSQLPAQFEPAKYERMVFGLILILMMIFRPQGILPPRRNR